MRRGKEKIESGKNMNTQERIACTDNGSYEGRGRKNGDDRKKVAWPGEKRRGEVTWASETEGTETKKDNIVRGKAVSRGDRKKVEDERR